MFDTQKNIPPYQTTYGYQHGGAISDLDAAYKANQDLNIYFQ